uniref:Uncharacterized protein n=1 Tax=Chromera velia CCMP2878 TaxID=1169474 RepID=A0A0G4F9K9_9ALVE|eukprot:Cvel_15919.t1-p1 / transcript=Cvel_15919.t1 / gene=Cvel_15919 / organism=Chromera_velia_CCMP2878 / gene_product=hypothetical protein / transcript_product=hypothetical protein / location=Cvel_scaffold1203:50655-52851(+) / protein_length=194 / sequence_SO=supercontig / SO=protein_coding / is_pseudo=false
MDRILWVLDASEVIGSDDRQIKALMKKSEDVPVKDQLETAINASFVYLRMKKLDGTDLEMMFKIIQMFLDRRQRTRRRTTLRLTTAKSLGPGLGSQTATAQTDIPGNDGFLMKALYHGVRLPQYEYRQPREDEDRVDYNYDNLDDYDGSDKPEMGDDYDGSDKFEMGDDYDGLGGGTSAGYTMVTDPTPPPYNV